MKHMLIHGAYSAALAVAIAATCCSEIAFVFTHSWGSGAALLMSGAAAGGIIYRMIKNYKSDVRGS